MHDRFHWNVMSGRYSEMPTRKWCPAEPKELRGQGKGNKQVGSGKLDPMRQGVLHTDITEFNEAAQSKYEELLELGLCREQARTVLPMGQYTEAYVTANLGDWLLFLKQRLDPHAQYEIRVYAQVVANILTGLFPQVMRAFYDYQLNGVKMSAQEMRVIEDICDMAHVSQWEPEVRQEVLEARIPTKRERQEFWRKINASE